MAYSKTTWQTGDTVTAELLNHMEDGIASADAKELPAVTSSDNGKVLQVSNGAWSKQTPSSGGLPSYTSDDNEKVLTVRTYNGGLVWAELPLTNSDNSQWPTSYAYYPYSMLGTDVPDGSLFDNRNTQWISWSPNEGDVSPVNLGNGFFEYTFTFSDSPSWEDTPNTQDIIFVGVYITLTDENWSDYYYNNTKFLPYNTPEYGAEGWNMTITENSGTWTLKIVTDSNLGKLNLTQFGAYLTSISPIALMLLDRFSNIGT